MYLSAIYMEIERKASNQFRNPCTQHKMMVTTGWQIRPLLWVTAGLENMSDLARVKNWRDQTRTTES